MTETANLINRLESFIQSQNRYHAFATYSYGYLQYLVDELRTAHTSEAPLEPIIQRLEGFIEAQSANYAFRTNSASSLKIIATQLRSASR